MKQQTYKILNEEFFDDRELTDDIEITDDESSNENEQDYTYNLQFIIYTWCLVDYKDEFSNRITTKTYNLLENPEYKPILEHTLNSIKKALGYILESSSLITDYSTLKFCSLNKKLTTEFPFIYYNKQSEWLSNRFDRAITLETSINLSNRKNTEKLIKLFYSFWRLQQIYNRLLIEKLFGTQGKAPDIQLGIIRKKPYEKANLYGLLPPDKAMSPRGYELIKILNYKDEAYKTT